MTDGTLGLYLGWVCVATAANITDWLVASGFDGRGLGSDAWAIGAIAIAGAAGVALAFRDRGRFAPTLGLAWGLAWLAVGRIGGGLVSIPAASAAIVAALAILAATALVRFGPRPAA